MACGLLLTTARRRPAPPAARQTPAVSSRACRSRQARRAPAVDDTPAHREACAHRRPQHIGPGEASLPQRADLPPCADGWHEAASEDNGGAIGLLLDDLRTVGHLPARPGSPAVQGVTGIENKRTTRSPSLLLTCALVSNCCRTLNSARYRAPGARQRAGAALRRVVALIGRRRRARAATPARLARTHSTRKAPVRCTRLSSGCVLRGHLAQALRRPATTPKWCIWSPCCRTWAG